jgi:hypothetical protein
VSDAIRAVANTIVSVGEGAEILFPEATIKSGVQLYQGAMVYRDPADSALLKTSPSGRPDFEAYGVSSVNQLGDGTLRAMLTFGPHTFENASAGNAVPATLPLGWPLYSKDNRTASLTDGGGIYPFKGWFGGLTGETTPRVIVWVGFCPFAMERLVISHAIGHADLSDAAATMDFTLYTLPGPAVVVSPPMLRSLTAYSGGGTASGTVAIGLDSDPDAIGDEKSIFTGGAAGVMTAGVNGAAGYALAAGGVIKAQYAADTTVAAFTAGASVVSLCLRPGSY